MAAAKTRTETILGAALEQIKTAAAPGWDWARHLRTFCDRAQTIKHIDECTPASIVQSVIETAKRGLSTTLSTGHANYIPRRKKNSEVYYLTYLTGYQGIRHLLCRELGFSRILAQIVRPGEHFRVDYYHEEIEHTCDQDPGPADDLRAAYAVGVMPDGTKVWRVLWRDDLERIKAKVLSQPHGDDPPLWETDWPAMCLKSAIRALGKAMDLPEVASGLLDDDDTALGRQVREAEAVPEPPAPSTEDKATQAQEDQWAKEAKEAGYAV